MFHRSCALALMMVVAAPVQAQTKVTIDSLKQIVEGLGYPTYGDGKNYVAVDGLTHAGGTVFFALENDGATLDIYKPFETPTAEQMRDVPATAMLKFNADHAFYYAIGQAGGKDRVVLQELTASASISPVFLRQQIDALRTAIDESKALWDAGQWGHATADKETGAKP